MAVEPTAHGSSDVISGRGRRGPLSKIGLLPVGGNEGWGHSLFIFHPESAFNAIFLQSLSLRKSVVESPAIGRPSL